MRSIRRLFVVVAALSLVASACGSEDADSSAGAESSTEADSSAGAESSTEADSSAGAESSTEASPAVSVPMVVVTTNILGDVVTEILGDQATVEVIMPVGADPHDFQASAQQVALLEDAQAIVTNGADFEEGLLDVVEAAASGGVPIFEATDAIETIEFGAHSDHDDEHSDEDHSDHDDEHSDEDHSDEDHDDEHSDEDHDGHDHSGDDPHFFTDSQRMATVVAGLTEFLIAQVDGIDAAALTAASDDYIAELNALDAEMVEILGVIPAEQRVLVTNHEVFGYFADRYDFEIAGVVIPNGTTLGGTSAGELAELIDVVTDLGVPAIFSDASASDELAQTLAAEVGDIEVVELYTESLGEAGSDGATYIEMQRTNANRIAAALQS